MSVPLLQYAQSQSAAKLKVCSAIQTISSTTPRGDANESGFFAKGISYRKLRSLNSSSSSSSAATYITTFISSH